MWPNKRERLGTYGKKHYVITIRTNKLRKLNRVRKKIKDIKTGDWLFLTKILQLKTWKNLGVNKNKIIQA